MKAIDRRLRRLEAKRKAARRPAHRGYLVFADEAELEAYRAQLGPGRSRERLTAFLAIASPDVWDNDDKAD